MTTAKWLLTMLFALLLPPAVMLESRALDQALDDHNVYKTTEMPTYSIRQDFSLKEALPMIRLEDSSGFFCTGTVISDDYVLTAAHCVIDHGFGPAHIKRIPIKIIGIQTNLPSLTIEAEGFAAALNQRADYALIRGNFSRFTKQRLAVVGSPENLGPIMVCGYPWGAAPTCYPARSDVLSSDSHFILQGILYPGMSGGPVLQMFTNAVVAVNTATLGSVIMVSPLVGLFETLGVRVIDQ